MSKTSWLLVSLGAGLILLGQGCLNLQSKQAGPAGVFRSVDRGENWTPAVSLPTAQGVKSIAGVNVFRFFPDPGDPNALYLASRNQGLFYTYNRGESWNRVEPLSGKFIYALAVDPHNKCAIFVSDGPHIYRTLDCSRSWQLVYTEERPLERFVALAVDYGTSTLVYGATIGGDVFRSTDRGASWQAVKRFGFEIRELLVDPFASRRVYVAAHRQGLYRSDDAGVNWANLSRGFDAYSEANNFYRLVLHPGRKNSLFWVSKYGILRSDDLGYTWQDIKLLTPPGSVSIFAFAVSPKNDDEMYYLATILNEKQLPVRSTFYKTADGGVNWVTKKLPTNTIPVGIHLHPLEPNMLFLGFTSAIQ
ncbi:MAG: hypothetical protein HYV42_03880 [Candidatus Magasanikbacteria bacterium]|nr:hypothetical protein [Candidatus Magasanikbacteria bacterium]